MRDAARAVELAGEVAALGAASAVSDLGVAAAAASAAVEGAYYNVLINMPGLSDRTRAAALRKEAEDLLSRTEISRARVTRKVREALGS